MDLAVILQHLIGPFPPTLPLLSNRVKVSHKDSYVIERLEFNTEANERISSFLLIPHTINYPGIAIFCHHQHAGNWSLGKSEPAGLAGDPDQWIAHELAELGFITFAPDALGFEERNDGDSHDRAYWEMTTRILRGETFFAKLIHDIRKGIDALFEQNDLAISQVGFIGHSYGGKMALLAPFWEDRIRVTVSNCGCITFRDSVLREAGVQMELCIPGILGQLDLEQIVAQLDPCSVLISSTDQDVWGMSAKQVYEYCYPHFQDGIIEWAQYPGHHIFTQLMRE